ncbi:acetyltransferase [Ferrimonas balearica]|uniref:acetyltransferase n=1 Tax=Ferrimonas balearica TaxID=44012 RepID=UPI001C99D915|nr:acetyltransferase [Ferrimonas balearica]MBY5991471.1 acetyltransferase [Ferrimonas balearica]
MLLRETESGDLVEVADTSALINPFVDSVMVQYQCGEDLADPELCTKDHLSFPSGEALPICWKDGFYRQK